MRVPFSFTYGSWYVSTMHVVYLTGDVSVISGGMRVIAQQTRGLASLGHHVEVWVKNGQLCPYYNYGCNIKEYDVKRLHIPDIIVMTDTSFITDTIEYRIGKKSFLLMQHDNEWVAEETGSHTYDYLISQHMSHFKRGEIEIIAVSGWIGRKIRQRYKLAAHVIPNGVDETLFYPDQPLIDTLFPSVLVFYDPQPWKGFETAMQGILKAQQTLPNLSVLIVGKYFPEVPKVKGMSFGFPFPAIYFNRPPQELLRKIFASASIFISASWAEGFGLPGLEAMSCGTAVISTAAGGEREYLKAGKNALVVPPGQPDAIAEGIIRLTADSTMRTTLSKSGRRTAKNMPLNLSILALANLMKETILKV